MKDIKTKLCTACKIYYEDIDYDDCPLCDLKGDDDAWRRTYESTHAALLKSEAEVERLTRERDEAKRAVDEVIARLNHSDADNERLRDSVELAWGIIANAGGGDWDTQHPTWKQAAIRWRDEYWHTSLERRAALAGSPVETRLPVDDEAEARFEKLLAKRRAKAEAWLNQGPEVSGTLAFHAEPVERKPMFGGFAGVPTGALVVPVETRQELSMALTERAHASAEAEMHKGLRAETLKANENLRAEVERLTKELTDLKGDNDAWRRTYESTHAELLRVRADVETLARRDADYWTRHCNAEREVERLREQVDTLRPHADNCNWGRRGDAYPCSCMTEAERLREALRDMVTLVEQVEAFPTIVAQHNGLTNEGLKQLDQARAILYEKDK